MGELGAGAAALLRVVGRHALGGGVVGGEGATRGIEVEAGGFEVGRRVGGRGAVGDVRPVVAQEREADTGRGFPAVVDALEVVVEEVLEVVDVFLLVEVVPLLRRADP